MVGDDKLPIEADAQQDIRGPFRFPNAAYSAPAPEEDYPVERVEAVYRRLDLRIIPGWLHLAPAPRANESAADLESPQLSGSSTFSVPPFAPTSAWHRR